MVKPTTHLFHTDIISRLSTWGIIIFHSHTIFVFHFPFVLAMIVLSLSTHKNTCPACNVCFDVDVQHLNPIFLFIFMIFISFIVTSHYCIIMSILLAPTIILGISAPLMPARKELVVKLNQRHKNDNFYRSFKNWA